LRSAARGSRMAVAKPISVLQEALAAALVFAGQII
jgi:hypothetical protein